MLKLAKSVVQRIGGEAAHDVALNGRAAKETAALSIPSFLVVTLQLGMVLLAMHLFQVETARGLFYFYPGLILILVRSFA